MKKFILIILITFSFSLDKWEYMVCILGSKHTIMDDNSEEKVEAFYDATFENTKYYYLLQKELPPNGIDTLIPWNYLKGNSKMTLENTLSTMGMDGWELVSVEKKKSDFEIDELRLFNYKTISTEESKFYFKRKIAK